MWFIVLPPARRRRAAAVSPPVRRSSPTSRRETQPQQGLRPADDRAVRGADRRAGARAAAVPLGRRRHQRLLRDLLFRRGPLDAGGDRRRSRSSRSRRSITNARRSGPAASAASCHRARSSPRPSSPSCWSPSRAHFAMGAFEVVWSLYLKELGASMSYIAATWIVFSVPMLLAFVGRYPGRPPQPLRADVHRLHDLGGGVDRLRSHHEPAALPRRQRDRGLRDRVLVAGEAGLLRAGRARAGGWGRSWGSRTRRCSWPDGSARSPHR